MPRKLDLSIFTAYKVPPKAVPQPPTTAARATKASVTKTPATAGPNPKPAAVPKQKGKPASKQPPQQHADDDAMGDDNTVSDHKVSKLVW